MPDGSDRGCDSLEVNADPQLRSVVQLRDKGDAAVRDLPSLEDDELMLLARGGVRQAFDTLVRRYQAAVIAYAAKQLGSLEAGQDTAQNVFLELFRYLPRYQPRNKFRAFLFRSALNACRMSKRSAARAKGTMTRLEEVPRTVEKLPNDQVLMRERLRETGVALNALPRKQRDVVVLRFIADLSYQEIAQTLEIPIGTVKSRLFNGLARLHTELGGERA